MTGFWPIMKRELFSFFVTPLAWVVFTAFLLIQGLHFYLVLANFATTVSMSAEVGPVQTFFGQTVFLYIPLFFVCPVLTMRLFAEERRSGTIEPLLTAPVTTAAVVLGKYAAVLVAYIVMWLPTLFYVWIVADAGHVDMQVVAASYLAVIAVGAGYLAIGTLTSAVTKSQLTAAIMAAMMIMGLFILGIGESILPDGVGRELCRYVSVWSHMNDFSRGVVDSRRLAFDATMIVLPLFITVRAIDAWRHE